MTAFFACFSMAKGTIFAPLPARVAREPTLLTFTGSFTDLRFKPVYYPIKY